jgi:hypothetical protein
MNYNDIFARLWSDYISQNPATRKVYDLFISEGETVYNDHIAFRTFNDPAVDIGVLSRVILANGYEEKGQYRFEEKKLFAKHFEHKTDTHAPRVFISELLTEEFSPYLQLVVKDWVSSIPADLLTSDELIWSGNVSGLPSWPVFEKLRQESEYAGWLYANGFRANHFTVSVNGLKKYDTIEKVNRFLKSNGFLLNDAGGEIQGTPGELLEQSSIRAGIVKMQFKEGVYEIPGCYYEFARRYPDADGKIYSGFIAKSANKIFQSTDFYKKPE